MDLEPGSIDSLRSSKYGGLFSPDNCICGELNRESGGLLGRIGAKGWGSASRGMDRKQDSQSGWEGQEEREKASNIAK